MRLKQHELSALFPAMPPAAFEEMVADVKTHGVRFPIVLYQGKVLDGWHRAQACDQLGIEPPVKQFRGNDPVAFVVSANRIRRHMSGGQLVHVLAAISQSKWAKRGEKPNGSDGPLTNDALARQAGVSPRTVKRAKKAIVNGSAALNEAVKAGDISINKASEIADLPKREQAKAIRETKAGESSGKTTEPASVPFDKYKSLLDEHEEMTENYAVLADEIKTCQALLKTEAAQELLKLREELRACRRSRDDAMNRAAELKKQCDWWKRTAKSLGWKPKDAK